MLARPKPSEVSLASSIYWNLDQVKLIREFFTALYRHISFFSKS